MDGIGRTARRCSLVEVVNFLTYFSASTRTWLWTTLTSREKEGLKFYSHKTPLLSWCCLFTTIAGNWGWKTLDLTNRCPVPSALCITPHTLGMVHATSKENLSIWKMGKSLPNFHVQNLLSCSTVCLCACERWDRPSGNACPRSIGCRLPKAWLYRRRLSLPWLYRSAKDFLTIVSESGQHHDNIGCGWIANDLFQLIRRMTVWLIFSSPAAVAAASGNMEERWLSCEVHDSVKKLRGRSCVGSL